jgi:hypothetical protein
MKTLVSALFALTLLGGGGLALAEEQGHQDLKKHDSVPPMTEPIKPDQGGKQEPSSKVQGTDGTPGAFADGTLTAPGAPKDVDTAPSKFSSRTNADDQLPTVGYRLKHLTDQQKSTLYDAIGTQGTTGQSSTLDEAHSFLGAEVPVRFAEGKLQPVPEAVTAKVPETKGLIFAKSGNKLVLVDSTMRIVVGVITR